MYLLIVAVFLITLFIFLHIQTNTLILQNNYLLSLIGLFGIAIFALFISVYPIHSINSGTAILRVLIGIIGLVFLSLAIIKFKFQDSWRKPPKRLLRRISELSVPHDSFCVTTMDDVSISAYHIHQQPLASEKKPVIIIAHGGFRSKDMLVNHLLATWLSEKFDVIGFDFRGHGQSGGYWTGDGKTVNDLKAIIDYSRNRLGYQKIGVYGRSMGGWSAVLEAVDFHDVDAISIAGMPPGFFTEVPYFFRYLKFIWIPGASLFVRIVTGVRMKRFPNIRSPINEISRVSPIPLLILYNEADPAAGVNGVDGLWETLKDSEKDKSYRHIESLPFTANQVFSEANEPKKLTLLPGIGHVYSLQSLRTLFIQLESWFFEHLA